ncbi:MAG TPA: LytTR family DNA-binding domain-containing protein [Usitatibacteraceae bacterium]|nr:LytTR family DNA-binding domain-containing protein [Usitatibacteraceae bacterium]
MPTAILAEDEPILRTQLESKLNKLWPELEIIASVEDGAAALEALEERAPDFMFLDIQMPEMTGVEVARHVGTRAHVVFVTAYDQYAIQAFETGAVDYILKPYTDERLAVSVERLKGKLASPPPDLNAIVSQLATQLRGGAAREKLQWIKASFGQNLRLIPVSDVLFFQSDEKYTRVVTAEAEALIKTPIRELLDGLDSEVFWQIHRSTLVNVNAIAGVTRDFRGQAHVKIRGKDETLTVSRIYSHLFRQM